MRGRSIEVDVDCGGEMEVVEGGGRVGRLVV